MAALAKSFTPTYHHHTYPAIDPSLPELSAKGKVVLITGGSRGIGKATARAFARANAYAIIITGRTQHTLLETKSVLEQINPDTKVRTFVGDVSNANAVRTIFESIKQEFGRVDVLVSNAGYLPEPAPISKQDVDDFWKGFEINTKGAFIVVRAFLGVASPNATLINVSTGLAHFVTPGSQAYSTSKTATLSFFEFVQNQNDALRVVSIHPGVILTDMSIKSGFPAQDDGESKHFCLLPSEAFQSDSIGTENLAAHFQVWLAGPDADFLKGKMVWANWDVEELKAKKDEILKGHLLELSLKGWERNY
jgi:NAD(P)-dependent dehydrogenase (short-subunit alcohol dehydrogenase family)